MTVLRVLRTSKATLSKVLYLDETGTDATGTVAVTVKRLDGTVVDSASATGPDANHQYTYLWPGLDTLDDLVVSWAAAISGDAVVLDQDRLQVVGGFLFSLAEGRASDSALTNTTKFPTAKLIEARTIVEDEAERICGQAFVPRFVRLQLDGPPAPSGGQPSGAFGGSSLAVGFPWLRTVRAVSVSTRFGQPFVPLTSTQLSYIAPGEDGVLRRTDGGVWLQGSRNIVVEVEHGRDYPPAEVARVGKIRFKDLLLASVSALPDRAGRVVNTDQGTVTLIDPSAQATGLPEVDAVYARYADPLPGFG